MKKYSQFITEAKEGYRRVSHPSHLGDGDDDFSSAEHAHITITILTM